MSVSLTTFFPLLWRGALLAIAASATAYGVWSRKFEVREPARLHWACQNNYYGKVSGDTGNADMIYEAVKNSPSDKVCVIFFPKSAGDDADDLHGFVHLSTQALVYPRPIKIVPLPVQTDLTPLLNLKAVAGSAIFVGVPEFARSFGARDLATNLAVWTMGTP